MQHLNASNLPKETWLFWRDTAASYSQLVLTAEDLICAPASKASVERIFSICGTVLWSLQQNDEVVGDAHLL